MHEPRSKAISCNQATPHAEPRNQFRLSFPQYHVIPKERRSIVQLQRGDMWFPTKWKHSKPQRGKVKRNPEKEYPGISNPKEDPS